LIRLRFALQGNGNFAFDSPLRSFLAAVCQAQKLLGLCSGGKLGDLRFGGQRQTDFLFSPIV
jgi:hypothetical protein